MLTRRDEVPSELGKLIPLLSYPTWEGGVAITTKDYICYGDIENHLESLRRKQMQHMGDRSHPVTCTLGTFKPLTYPGWEGDVHQMEQCLFGGRFAPCAGVSHETEWTRCMAKMHRQAVRARWRPERPTAQGARRAHRVARGEDGHAS